MNASAKMDIDSGENSASVRIWILEYACKFRMKKLVHELFKEGPWKCEGCAKDSEHCINPVYLVYILFKDLTDSVKMLLDQGVTVAILKTINKGTLQVCLNCLEALYVQKRKITFTVFYKQLFAFKLLFFQFLIVAMLDGEEKERISELVDIYFPRYNKLEHVIYTSSLKLTEEEATSHKNKEQEARVFILQMLLKHGRQDNDYIESYLVPQARAMLRSILDVMPELMETSITPYMSTTFIEKLLTGTEDKNYKKGDPAVKVLLEFLHPNVTEDELICALNALNPKKDIVSLAQDEAAAAASPPIANSALSLFHMA